MGINSKYHQFRSFDDYDDSFDNSCYWPTTEATSPEKSRFPFPYSEMFTTGHKLNRAQLVLPSQKYSATKKTAAAVATTINSNGGESDFESLSSPARFTPLTKYDTPGSSSTYSSNLSSNGGSSGIGGAEVSLPGNFKNSVADLTYEKDYAWCNFSHQQSDETFGQQFSSIYNSMLTNDLITESTMDSPLDDLTTFGCHLFQDYFGENQMLLKPQPPVEDSKRRPSYDTVQYMELEALIRPKTDPNRNSRNVIIFPESNNSVMEHKTAPLKFLKKFQHYEDDNYNFEDEDGNNKAGNYQGKYVNIAIKQPTAGSNCNDFLEDSSISGESEGAYVPILDQLFKDEKILNEIRTMTKKGKYKCSHCPLSFKDLFEFAKHLDEARVVRAYKCTVDGCPWKIFGLPRSAELRRHITSQHLGGEESHITKSKVTGPNSIINKKLTDGNMNINVNNELENVKSGRIDMKYPCTEKHCNKKFCRKDSLTRHHRLVHLNKTSRFNRRIAKDNIQ